MTLDQLTAEGAQVVSRAEIWVNGQQADQPPIIDGSVTYDAAERVIRSCQVTVLGDLPAAPSDPLSPIGSEVRLFRGARDWTGEVFEEPLGRYAFDTSTVDRADRTVRIAGYDYAQLVTDARWETPFAIVAGTNLADAISDSIQSRLPPSLWQPPTLVSTDVTVPAVVWGEERDNDPMDDIRGLAAADGLEIGFDRAGRLTLAGVPDPDVGQPRWDYTLATSPTYLTASKELSGRPYNVVVARGEPADDIPPVEATVEDDDPASASYIGRYRRPYFLTSSYITTEEQAFRAAEGQLRRLVGLAEIVTMRVVPHPGLDIRQIVRAHDPDLRVDARYIVDRVELPLLPGEATVTTRRRRI